MTPLGVLHHTVGSRTTSKFPGGGQSICIKWLFHWKTWLKQKRIMKWLNLWTRNTNSWSLLLDLLWNTNTSKPFLIYKTSGKIHYNVWQIISMHSTSFYYPWCHWYLYIISSLHLKILLHHYDPKPISLFFLRKRAKLKGKGYSWF